MNSHITIKQAIKAYNKSDSTIRRLIREMKDDDRDKHLSTDSKGRNLISIKYLDKVYKPRSIAIYENRDLQLQVVNASNQLVHLTDQFERLIKLQEDAKNRELRILSAIENMTEQMKKSSERDMSVISLSDYILSELSNRPKKKSKKGKKKKKKGKKQSKPK